jgi:hypothetical protein
MRRSFIEASTCQGGLNLQMPRDELLTVESLTIRSIVRDLELHQRRVGGGHAGGLFLSSLCSLGSDEHRCNHKL